MVYYGIKQFRTAYLIDPYQITEFMGLKSVILSVNKNASINFTRH